MGQTRSAAGTPRAGSAWSARDEREDVLRAYGRAVGGGLLVGLPLLFTMEMWWHAFLIPSWKILLLLAVAAAIVVAFNAVTGFRRDRTWAELLIDSVEAIGIGIVVAAIALLLLGRLDLGTSLRDAVGKIALEAIPIAFGASLATAQLGRGSGGEGRDGDGDAAGPAGGDSSGADRGEEAGSAQVTGSGGRLLIGAGGALVFAINVAPTEEPVLLGIEAEWWLLLLVMAATYLVTLGMVFFAEFRGGRRQDPETGPLASPWGETIVAYALSLATALLLLWAFGRTQDVGLAAIAGQVVMLGVVASFGAAVGRILVQGGGASSQGERA